MNNENMKSLWIGLLLFSIIFIIPYYCRKGKEAEIDKYKLFAIGHITKQTGSLKNGKHWHYEFEYKNEIYRNYRSTHVGYNINIGDLFLVQFSEKDPNKNRILYEYKIDPQRTSGNTDIIWKEIPLNSIEFNKKNDKWWE